MVLKKLFNKGSEDITPLNKDEKVFFVKLFFELEGIGSTNSGEADSENDADIIGTPQYTLTSYLDFFYVFMRNSKFRDSHMKAASEMGVDISDFKLTPISMIKLGGYYTNLRNMSESELEEVKDIWREKLNESDQNDVYTLEEAVFYWAEIVVTAVQIIDFGELGQSRGGFDVEFSNMAEQNLSLNVPLVNRYLDMRESVK